MKDATYTPNESEIAQLISIVGQPGYVVLQKIFMGVVDQFQVELMNVDLASDNYDSQVRTKHNLALAAARFYQDATKVIRTYVEQYKERQSQPAIHPDQTEDILNY